MGIKNDDINTGGPDGSRLELEKKLFHSYQLLQYIIEHDLTAIAVLDRDLKYVYVSRKYLSDYNLKEREILGKRHYDIFHDLSDSWKEVHKKALTGETLSADDDSFTSLDGTKVWVRWVCKPWYGAEGTIEGIVLYTEVITKKKEIEIELTIAKEKAEESDHLKTAFLQNISHEVRTPLNSIVGFSELLADPRQTIQKVRSYSKIISLASHKLISIISDVIDIAQIQSGQVKIVLSKFEIVTLLYKVTDAFREIAQLNEVLFLVHHTIPEDMAMIVSDKGKVEKILFHLLDNAVKFTKRGSIKVTCNIRDNELYFIISDTGIGINLEDQEKIFHPFRQAETGINHSFGGTGLGLSIVKAYSEALKGSVLLTSELNKGTTFNVTLPIHVEPSVKHDQRAHFDDQVSTILIAEDEYSNFRYLYEVLHSDRINILHANNGNEAVDICRKSDEIDIILMDLRMPVMDGTAAAKHIRKIRPRVPIIAQTAYVPDGESINSIFDDLISKPINKKDLTQKMRRYINI